MLVAVQSAVAMQSLFLSSVALPTNQTVVKVMQRRRDAACALGELATMGSQPLRLQTSSVQFVGPSSGSSS